jgi:hypothetical protein
MGGGIQYSENLKMHTRFKLQNLKERDHFENLGTEGQITLERDQNEMEFENVSQIHCLSGLGPEADHSEHPFL